MKKDFLSKLAILITTIGLTSCSSISLPSLPSFTGSNTKPSGSYSTALWEGSNAQIWDKLVRMSSLKLATLQASTTDATQKAWIQLALIVKRNSTNTPVLTQEINAWKTENPSHPANSILASTSTLSNLATSSAPVQIAVLIPQQGPYAAAGAAVRAGVMKGYYNHQAKGGNQQSIKFYDTTTSSMGALYQQAISEGASFVIGPLLKNNVSELISSASISVNTLALNYTDGSLPSKMYEFGLLPEDEAGQIAERARAAGRSSAIIIAPNSAWGTRLVSTFTDRWESMGGSIRETWYFDSSTNFNQAIPRLLKANPNVDAVTDGKAQDKQRRQDFDVIFLFAQPSFARSIVPLLRYYYASNIPIYSTSAVYAGKPNRANDVDLGGVIVCDIPAQSSKSNDGVRADRMYAVGQDAYMLSQLLPRLVGMPRVPIYGATGSVTLDSNNKIHRNLPCTPIRNANN